MKIAVVDIDQILWSMGEAWYEEIIKINPECPYPGKSTWDFYKGFLTEKELQLTIDNVHMKQNTFEPFKKAPLLTRTLREHDFYIKIASHRNPRTKCVTEDWLLENGIYFDDLYAVTDKHFLLEDATVFIDDSPHSQAYAIEKGVKTFSIMYPYNRHMDGVVFSKDFEGLLHDVEKWCSQFKRVEPSFDNTVTIKESTYNELTRKADLLDLIIKEGPEFLQDYMRGL